MEDELAVLQEAFDRRMPRTHLGWAIAGTLVGCALLFVVYKQSCDAEALRQRELLA